MKTGWKDANNEYYIIEKKLRGGNKNWKAHTKEKDEEKVSTTMDDGEVFGEMDGGVCEVVDGKSEDSAQSQWW